MPANTDWTSRGEATSFRRACLGRVAGDWGSVGDGEGSKNGLSCLNKLMTSVRVILVEKVDERLQRRREAAELLRRL